MPKIPTKDDLILEEAKSFVKEYHLFKEWLSGLDKLTRSNFQAMINLPHCSEVVQECPNPELKRWTLFAIKLKEENPAGNYLDKLQTLDEGYQTRQAKAKHVKHATQDRSHHCHWPGCTQQVPPAKWGCYKHWMMLPKHFRDALWEAYRIGQEVRRTPSREYVKVARDVQNWIKEHHDVD